MTTVPSDRFAVERRVEREPAQRRHPRKSRENVVIELTGRKRWRAASLIAETFVSFRHEP